MENPCNAPGFEALIERTLRQYGSRVHLQLVAWLADHPGPQNPVAFVAPNEGLCRVVTRDEAIELLRAAWDDRAADLLARAPCVPRGSVDLVVSTPVDLAIARATPHAVCMS